MAAAVRGYHGLQSDDLLARDPEVDQICEICGHPLKRTQYVTRVQHPNHCTYHFQCLLDQRTAPVPNQVREICPTGGCNFRMQPYNPRTEQPVPARAFYAKNDPTNFPNHPVFGNGQQARVPRGVAGRRRGAARGRAVRGGRARGGIGHLAQIQIANPVRRRARAQAQAQMVQIPQQPQPIIQYQQQPGQMLQAPGYFYQPAAAAPFFGMQQGGYGTPPKYNIVINNADFSMM